MKWAKILGIFFCFMTLITFTIPSCQATIEKEFVESRRYMYGEELFALRVKVIVETEIDGTWRKDVPYRMTLLCYLTYIKQDVIAVVINETRVYFPALMEIMDIIYEHEGLLGREEISLSHLYKPSYIKIIVKPKVTGRGWLEFDFRYSAYSIYGSAIISRESWSSVEPIYIDVTATDLQTEIDDLRTDIVHHINSLETQLATIRNVMYVFIVITVFLFSVNLYFSRKKPKGVNN